MNIHDFFSYSDILEFFIIYFFSFLGSFAKTYLSMLKNSSIKFKEAIITIILSNITSSILIFTISSNLDSYFGNIKLTILLSFIAGLVGFEILIRISTVGGILNIINRLIKLYLKNYYNYPNDNESKKK